MNQQQQNSLQYTDKVILIIQSVSKSFCVAPLYIYTDKQQSVMQRRELSNLPPFVSICQQPPSKASHIKPNIVCPGPQGPSNFIRPLAVNSTGDTGIVIQKYLVYSINIKNPITLLPAPNQNKGIDKQLVLLK